MFQEQQEGRGGSSGLSERTLTRQGQTMKEKGDAEPLSLYCNLSEGIVKNLNFAR